MFAVGFVLFFLYIITEAAVGTAEGQLIFFHDLTNIVSNSLLQWKLLEKVSGKGQRQKQCNPNPNFVSFAHFQMLVSLFLMHMG